MKRPVARTISSEARPAEELRSPRAFVPASVEIVEHDPAAFDTLESGSPELQPHLPKGLGWTGRLAWGAGSLLVSLGLGLMADRLIRDLFATYEWLGWVGLAALGVLVLALIVIAAREMLALRRLKNLDGLKDRAAEVLVSNDRKAGQSVLGELSSIYHPRADLARARQTVDVNVGDMFDGAEMIRLAERSLMAPLDARARALTAASARRVALVTAVSPRALIDAAFVIFECFKLAGAIARLYGARPGFFGFWRLAGAILAHLAVTGGLVLTDGIIEQLVGQGLAAKLSARLGEGVVNGLMTVRVGIAAMRVVRPLPFDTQPMPVVKDFIPELANVAQAGR